MKKNILLGLLIMLGLVLTACKTDSISTFDYIIDESFDEFIVMGTSADYPPYEWPKTVDGKLTLVGIDIEIAKEIAKKVGKNLKVVNKNFDFLLEDLESGKVDFVMAAMTPSEDRKKRVDFSDIYYFAEQVALIHKDNLNEYTSVESLDQTTIRIGAQLGTVQQELVDSLFNNAQTRYIKQIPTLIMNLQDKQIGALVVERPIAEGYKNNTDDLVIANIDLPQEDDNGFAVAVSKGNTSLLNNINEVLQALINSGQMDEIVKTMTELNN
ncbi:MAG TPA: transporter substrate-binding domain-containing protein [Acholeplasmataceae bacterium]|nr:transporter substrate-binding domain-containing protein [Acholeplasmataceae bacterium]